MTNLQQQIPPETGDMAQMEDDRDEFRRDIFWLVMGGLSAFWLCVGITVANNWHAIEGWFA